MKKHERAPAEMEPEYLCQLSHELYARCTDPSLRCTQALHERSAEIKAEIERRLRAQEREAVEGKS